MAGGRIRTDIFRTAAWLAACAVLSLGPRAFAQANTWVTRAPMPEPREGATAAVISGKLYVTGGWGCTIGLPGETFAYDPGADTWGIRASMPTRRSQAAGGVVDGIFYVIGGGGAGGSDLGTVEAYDPEADSWTARASMPTQRFGAAAAVIDGIIYVAGGDGTSETTLEAYNPKTNSWTTKSPMPTPRFAPSAVSIGGLLYLVGGVSQGSPAVALNSVESYDPNTDTWTARAAVPTARYWSGAGLLDGMLYVVGGSGYPLVGVAANNVEAYDPAKDSWVERPPLPTGRFLAVTGVSEDVLYAVGGSLDRRSNPQPCLATNEAFTPFETVSIDIKPGDRTKTINLGSHGVVPVAILGSATFDPMTVDPTTVTLAGAHVAIRGRGVPMTGQSDVNHDGYPDLLLYFRTQDMTALQPASADPFLRQGKLRSALPPSPAPDSPSVDGPGGRNPNPESQRVAEAVLYGTTYSGQRIRGSDTVRIVPAVQTSPRAFPRGRTAVASRR